MTACGVVFASVLWAAALGAQTTQPGGARRSVPASQADPPAYLADVSVTVVTYPESLTVGDRATFEVVVEAPPEVADVLFPPGNPIAAKQIAVHGLEVQPPDEAPVTGDAQQDDNENVGSSRTWIGRYAVGVYAVGDVVLPPWPVQVQAGSLSVIVRSDSVRFFVESVLDDSLAAADIRDLKPQRDVPVPVPWWVWAILAAVLVLILLGFLRRRMRRPKATVPLAPPRPAHVIALAALRELESSQLPAQGSVKQHYMRLSEILRTYLENAPQFGVPALEETSYEIITEVTNRRFKSAIIDELTEMCEESDLVKFAKHQPPVDECTAALERTRRFVLDTSKATAVADLRSPPEPVAVTVGVAGPGGRALDGSAVAVSPDAPAGNGSGGGVPPAPKEDGGHS